LPRAGHHIRPSANLLPNGGRPRGVISTVSCVVCRFGSKHELNSKLSAFMEAPLQYYLESARKNHLKLLLAFFIYRPPHYTYHQRAFDWLLPHAKCFIPQLTFRFLPTPQRDGTPCGGVARRRVLVRVPEIVRDLVNQSLSYIPVISKRHVWPVD
jgi:hypothetical protein